MAIICIHKVILTRLGRHFFQTRCTAIHVGCSGKYRTIDKLKIHKIHKLYTTQKKQTTQKNTAKQNYPGSVTFYNTQPGKEMSLLYNAPEPTQGTNMNNTSSDSHQQ